MAAKKQGKKRATAPDKAKPPAQPEPPVRVPEPVDELPPPPTTEDASAGERGRQDLPVAGLVASAGGLDAFKKFFAAMPADSGIAFVVFPHLDPHHDSLMVDLLSRHTSMPVVEAAEGIAVEPNRVYIIPPNKNMTIADGVTFTDVTQARLAEERLRLAMKAGEMGTWDWEFATDTLTWDSRQFELFGIRPQECGISSGKAIGAIHPQDQPRVEAAITRARDHCVPFREEFRVVHPNGSIHWLVGLGKPIIINAGVEVARMIGVNFDITSRKQAEHALRQLNASLENKVAERTLAVHEREECLQAILNTAADAIISINEKGTIQSVNRATERMFGYTAAEMINQNIKILMPSPYREEHDRYLDNYDKTGVKKIIGIGREIMARRKDGSKFPVDLAVSEVEHLKLFTGILRDISRRKELEREVVEIASLEQRRIGQDLHDSVSQELTALNMLAGNLAKTLQSNPANAPALVEQMVLGLQRSQQELRAVMRGLCPVSVDAEGLMAALSDLANRTRQEGKAACVFDCPKPVLVADNLVATHLYLIAQEAVHNAVKHSRCQNIRISVDSNAILVLGVQDDGIGISDISAESHAGLGLRIMRNRAAIIGATLTIEPAQPAGTVVTCTLRGKHNAPQQ